MPRRRAANSNRNDDAAPQPPPGGSARIAASQPSEPAEARSRATINEPGNGGGAGDAGAQSRAGKADSVPLDPCAIAPSQAGPLEVMLEAMRFHHAIARHALGAAPSLAKADLKTAAEHFDQAHRVAKDVAPYLNPKAKDIEPKGEASDAVQIDGVVPLSELEAARRLAFLLELAARGLLDADDRGKAKGDGAGKTGDDVDE